MQLSFTRDTYTPTETRGVGLLGNLHTIEQPWVNNEDGHSCAPDGLYDLIPYYSDKHGCWTWCLHNPDLGIWATQDMIPQEARKNGRFVLELHSANWAFQLKGCIAPGLTCGMLEDKWAVMESKEAMQKIIAALAPDGDIENATGHTLLIQAAPGLLGTSGYTYIPA